ncbi:MAG TPA: cell division protein FtsQ/DivIB [Burkholderiaceae bacterium]
MATRPNHTVKPRIATALPVDVRLMNAVAGLVFMLAAAALLAALGAWLLRAPLFTLRTITLDGELARSNLATVRANALPQVVGNFFSLDLDRARAAFESVPWVRQAVVRRVWPNRLAITLEEHRAAALWQGLGDKDSGSDRLVNDHGEVFEANLGDVEDENLMTLAGPEGSSMAMLALQRRLADTLAPIAARIGTLKLSSRGSWRAELDSGASLELGRGGEDEVIARTARFVRTFALATQRFADAGGSPRALIAADLRHPDGYALRLRGVSTTPIAAASKTAAPR